MEHKNMTLLIMAAGMGSRFGGLKQIEPVGPEGEFIIDYSIYDAIQAGFNKVVFIIKRENYDLFRSTIGTRVEPHIDVSYVFQEMENVPSFVEIPSSRVAPWGTGQAILAAKDEIHEPFAVINADDFYGADAYQVAANFLRIAHEKEKSYAVICYEVSKTMSENGSVKRGVCEIQDRYLKGITESKVEREGEYIVARPLSGAKEFTIPADRLVSMNLFCFSPDIFSFLEADMERFFKREKDNLLKCEFLIPEVVSDAIQDGIFDVKILSTKATWYGVTYREDKDTVVKAIQKMVDDKKYPLPLWK